MDEELKIAKHALEEIVGYYRRSHKHSENTCLQMCREAEVALQEMSRLRIGADDAGQEGCLGEGHSGSSLTCEHPFCVSERMPPS